MERFTKKVIKQDFRHFVPAIQYSLQNLCRYAPLIPYSSLNFRHFVPAILPSSLEKHKLLAQSLRSCALCCFMRSKIQASLIFSLLNNSATTMLWLISLFWSGEQDLNLRPHAPQTCTLPDCATTRNQLFST